MSDDELKAYLSCLTLTQQNIFLTPSQYSASSQSFSIQISLHKALGDKKIPITINVIGAKITGVNPGNWKISNNNARAAGVIQEGDQASARITRNPHEPFEITASAEAENETLTLPAPPTMHLVEELRYGSPQRSACKQCLSPSLQSGMLTFNAKTDEVIKPRSEYVEVEVFGVSPVFSPNQSGFYYQNLDTKRYSERYDPRDFYVPLSVAPPRYGTSSWCVAWMGQVKVFVAVPIGQQSSGREPSKPDLACALL